MPTLVLKLVLTPLLVGGASLAARRWGPSIGGWIVSLPLTSGPILFFLALDQGPAFAADASVGTLLGLAAIAGFAAAYATASPRGPLPSIAAASVAFVVVGFALQAVAAWPFAVLVVLVSAAIAAVISRLPAGRVGRSSTGHPRWDLPARVVVGTVLVVGLTAIAPRLGPVTSGIVSTFPAYVSVLAVFAHVQDGRFAALGVLRGLLTGLFGTVAFYVVVHTCVVPLGIAPTFALAIVVAVSISAVALRRIRHSAVGDDGPDALPEPA